MLETTTEPDPSGGVDEFWMLIVATTPVWPATVFGKEALRFNPTPAKAGWRLPTSAEHAPAISAPAAARARNDHDRPPVVELFGTTRGSTLGH